MKTILSIVLLTYSIQALPSTCVSDGSGGWNCDGGNQQQSQSQHCVETDDDVMICN